ncbi:MAG TPA: hypothetical protein VGN61_11030 [Verrucomicrobiae bacterium]|jgi:hypothetical protein
MSANDQKGPFERKRSNLLAILVLILIVSIYAFVTDCCAYRMTSVTLDMIRNGPHFAYNKDLDERTVSDFGVIRDCAAGGMERHSVVILLGLFGLCCAWRMKGGCK